MNLASVHFTGLLPGQGVAVAVAAIGLAVWFGLLGMMVVATRSPSPRPGMPPDPNRLDAESPALVDLLTGDWKLCEEAAASTVLDLAARRVVAVEEIGPELSLVRLGRGDPPDLKPYEQMVLDHLRRLATPDGVVATGALAEGNRNIGSWWKSFTHAVIEEARALGLSQRRWTAWHRTVLSVAAGIPGLAVAAAFWLAPNDDGSDLFGSLGAGFVVGAMLVAFAEKMNGERATDLGLEVAGRWLGLREHLAGGRFAEQPAAAVTIWGRPLAYAATLGLAPRAVVSLPIASAADDRRAWSDYGGMWHVVDVRYGRGGGPLGFLFWGRSTLSAVGTAFFGGVAAFMISLFALMLSSALLDIGPDDPIAAARRIGLVVGAIPLAMALLDLVSRRSVHGQVVRKRRYARRTSGEQTKYRHWIAIDEGTSRRLSAFGIDEDDWHRLEEGDVVTARVGRRLGYIHGVEVTTPSRHRGGAVVPPADQAPAVPRPHDQPG
jgi:Predicted membrane protein (DUF2207)